MKARAFVGEFSSETATREYLLPTPIEVATPVINPENGEFSDSVEVSITCATEGASIFYTTNGETPTDGSNPYTGSFILYETSSVKAIAYLQDQKSNIAENSYVIIEVAAPIEVTTLAELRDGQTDGSIYHYSGEAVVTFAMTFRSQKYIQDETAAILIDDFEGAITTAFEVSNGITDLTGTLFDYNGLLEFVPTKDAGKTSNPTVTVSAQEISISEFKSNFEDYEAELIKLNGVTFDTPGTFENGKNYTISAEGESTILRTHFYDVDYIGSTMYDGKMNVTGIALWDNGEAKIVPRAADDIEELTGIAEIMSAAKIYGQGQSIKIESVPKNHNLVEIYSIDGKKLKTISSNESNFTVPMEKTGLYLVVLSHNHQGIRSEKVMLK